MLSDANKLRKLLEKETDKIPDNRGTSIMLSGGLDSSALACILLNKGRSLRSISSSFKKYPTYDETKYIELIKKRYPKLEINYITPLNINLLNELKELIGIIKEPITSGSFLLQYLIMKRAKKLGIRELIYGQWADELMGGYDTYLLARAHDDLKKIQLSNVLTNIKEYIYRSQENRIDFLILLRILKRIFTSKGLKNELIMSIVNFCQSLDLDRVVYKGQTKIILREAVADVLPERILNRRIKYAFFAPDTIWLLKNKENIMKIKDKIVREEYKKFLRNPQKRYNEKLWITLSNIFIT